MISHTSLDKESSKEGSSKTEENDTEKTSSKSKTSAESVAKADKVEKKPVLTTNNDVRQKCREMIQNALKLSEEDNNDHGMKYIVLFKLLFWVV